MQIKKAQTSIVYMTFYSDVSFINLVPPYRKIVTILVSARFKLVRTEF